MLKTIPINPAYGEKKTTRILERNNSNFTLSAARNVTALKQIIPPFHKSISNAFARELVK
jgi:hypothetical protein